MNDKLYPNNKNLIITYSGIYIDLLNPKEEDINIYDIAHQLSNHCRFGGAIKSFYSVAMHSVEVASKCPDEYKLVGLLHDASEAYLCDIPTPIKNLLPEYLKIEERFMKVISSKFNIPYPYPEIVHKIDKMVMVDEFNGINNIVENKIYSHMRDKEIFLDLFKELTE